MTEYIKCSNCKCKFIDNDEHIKNNFGYKRLGERFKCCFKCRERSSKACDEYRMKYRDEVVICDKCGEGAKRYNITTHKRRFQCQVFGVEPRPTFKEWLLQQNEETLVSEYRKMLQQLKETDS